MICNDTEFILNYNQLGSKERPEQLKPNETKSFFWVNKNLKQMIEISLLNGKQEWKCSGPLSISNSTETFIVRNRQDESKFKILSI